LRQGAGNLPGSASDVEYPRRRAAAFPNGADKTRDAVGHMATASVLVGPCRRFPVEEAARR